MLNSLRNAARGLTAKILLGLLIASFAVWGVSGAFSDRASTTVIAAGETVVGPTEYALAYTRAVNDLSARFGTRLTTDQAQALGVEQSVVSELVTGAVLDEQARMLELGVSEDELAKLVAEDPTFAGLDGRFDRSQFSAILRNVGMTEEEYLESRADVARRQQLVNTVAGEVVTPAAYASARTEFDAQTRDISFLSLTDDILADAPAPTDEEIAAFFKANAGNYDRPEYRTVQYAVLSEQTLADPEAIAEETVRAAYDADIARYTVPASRDFERLVLPTREEAEAAAARIASGEITFDALIEERGVDRNSILVRGATRETFPDRDAGEAAFALGLNEVGEPYDTRFGTVLLRPTRSFEAAVRPYEEVRDELRRELAENEANALIGDVLDAYTDERAGGATLAEAAAAQGLEIETIEAVDARGLDPDGSEIDVPISSLVTSAFDTEPGSEADPLNVPGGGAVLYEVTATEAARPYTLEEIRDRVAADFEADRTADALGTRAAELERNLREGQTLEEIATGLGLEIEREFALRRNAEGDADPTRRAAIFGGPAGHVALAETEEGYDLIRIDAITRDASATDVEAAPIAEDLLQQLVGDLQAQYVPTYDAALAERIRQQ